MKAMTTEEFAKQMDRIVDSFDEKTYNRERVRLIYKEVKELTQKEFESICDEFIGRNSFRYPPLVPAFREAALLAKKRRLGSQTKAAATKLKSQAHRNDGLKQYLDKLGAKSVFDAMKKLRQ